MSAVAADQAAATREPGGPQGPVDVSWLILARLDDLRRAQDELRADFKGLEAKLDTKIDALETKLNTRIDALETKLDTRIGTLETKLDAKIESVRSWSLGLLLLAILSLAAKLLIPGA